MKFKFIFKCWVKPVLQIIAIAIIVFAVYLAVAVLFVNGNINKFALLDIIAAVCFAYCLFLIYKRDSFYCEIKDDTLFVKIFGTLTKNKISDLCVLKKTNKGFVIFKSHRIIVRGNRVQFPIYPEDGDKFIEELIKINPEIKLT